MMFGIGKLYRCPKYYLLVFPSKEKATAALVSASVAAAASSAAASGADYYASWWSKHLGCKVYYNKPGDIFMVLEQPAGEYIHVLFGEKQGWIIFKDWLEIEFLRNC